MKPGTAAPWRVVFCGRTPCVQVDSHSLELLNPEPAGDFSWVKTGVCTWDWRIDGAKVEGFEYGMSYESWVRMIDFSAAHRIKHLVLDANWHGPEFCQKYPDLLRFIAAQQMPWRESKTLSGGIGAGIT